MCGIIGSINIAKPLDLKSIQHRGPDDFGIYEEDNIKFGHTRLSIQDLSQNGHQPYLSQDGNYIMVFNGEIYNHWTIRKQLEDVGYKFTSTCDTETILQGYIAYDIDIISKLNGIFTLAIYDRVRHKVIIARDRFGVKPLYYFNENNTFGFSSEIKALRNLLPDDLNIDYQALSNYVRFLWSPRERTPFKEVKKLLPGRILEINTEELKHTKETTYYTSGFNGIYSDSSEKEIVDELEQHLLKAVEMQMLSDVPVGFFLSGGLDSSLLVAITKKLFPERKLQCFTIDTGTFSDTEGFTDDLKYAIKIADYLNVDLEVVKADVEILEDFDQMIWHLDEPQADPAPLNVLNISRRAKEMGYKVLIGGTGGDDVFSGYRRHQALKYERILRLIPSFIRPLLMSLTNILNSSNSKFRRLKKIVNTLKYSNHLRTYSYFEWLPYKTVINLFVDVAKGQLKKIDPFDFFHEIVEEIPEEKNPLNRLLHIEMNSFLVDHNFNYTDKMGMAEGVEIRVPYLENNLVNFSYSIPPHLKLKGNETKYILKKVAERYLPKEVIYRSKTGFGAPVRKWITEDLVPMIDDRLSVENLDKLKIFNPDKIRELIQQNKNGKIDASYSIWALLAIESWMKQFNNTEKFVNNETDNSKS